MTPTRDEWLQWRRAGIGASDIAAILGISPFASPWSVWADKIGLLPPEPDNEYMAAGRWLERAIGPWFEDETGLFVIAEQLRVTSSKHDWMRCTPDGAVAEDTAADLDSALGGLEIKVTGPGRRWDGLPAHYQAQGQWQMMCTGWERIWFAVLMGRRLDIHVLERDEADMSFMYEAADVFWNDHVLAAQPPPTDGHDATLRALSVAYADSTPGAVPLGSEDMTRIQEWRDAKAAEKAAKTDAKTAAAAIQATLAEAEEGTWLGQRVVTWRPQTRKTRCKHCHAVDESDPFRVLREVKPRAT